MSALKKSIGEGFLVEVKGDVAVGVACGLEGDAEEVGDVAFEGGGDLGAVLFRRDRIC